MIPNPSSSWAAHKVFNIGNSSPIPLMNYIHAVEKSLNRKALIEYLPMQQGDVPATAADTTLLSNWIDFRPQTSVESGVANFVDWYKSFYGV